MTLRKLSFLMLLTALLTVFGCTKDIDKNVNENEIASAIENELTLYGPNIENPEMLSSQNGVLNFNLSAAPAEITVAGETFTSNVYSGQYIAPVLRVKRGDTINITYVNNIAKADIEIDQPQSSNVHYHGLGIYPMNLQIIPTFRFLPVKMAPQDMKWLLIRGMNPR